MKCIWYDLHYESLCKLAFNSELQFAKDNMSEYEIQTDSAL